MTTVTANSVLVQVADAVAAELNAGDFSIGFEAERSYADWEFPIEERDRFDCVLVDVIPGGVRTELQTRGSVEYEVLAEICIRKKFGQWDRDNQRRVTLADVDALVALQQEIFEYFMPGTPGGEGRRLASLPEAVWGRTEIRAAFTPAHLRHLGQYTSVVSVSYLVTPEGEEGEA